MALALRTMSSLVAESERFARSLACHLLSPVRPGTVELTPRIDRTGGSATSTSLSIRQKGALVATAVATHAIRNPSITYIGVTPPDAPPPTDCPPLLETVVEEARAGMLVEHRPVAPPRLLNGDESARIAVWMRLLEDRAVDAISATMLAAAANPEHRDHDPLRATRRRWVEPVGARSVRHDVRGGRIRNRGHPTLERGPPSDSPSPSAATHPQNRRPTVAELLGAERSVILKMAEPTVTRCRILVPRTGRGPRRRSVVRSSSRDFPSICLDPQARFSCQTPRRSTRRRAHNQPACFAPNPRSAGVRSPT
jgi:Thioesterase-like superfamily